MTKKWLKTKVPDSPGENSTFSRNSILPEMCHLLSRTTLLLTKIRFIIKKPFKMKVPDSPVRMALFQKFYFTKNVPFIELNNFAFDKKSIYHQKTT